MNILHISRTMGQGGAEKVVYQLCRDAENKMVVASTGGNYESDLHEINVRHYTIPDINGKNPLSMFRTLFILKKIIKKEEIDIVHSHHRMAAFYSKLLNIFNKRFKRIYTSHNVFFDKKRLLRFSLKGSAIVAVGDGVKKNLMNCYGIKFERIKVIYNSIEIPEKINLPNDEFIKKKKDNTYICTIGRLSEQKGIDVFLRAIAKVIQNNKSVYGIIIGDGELKEDLIKLSQKLNIENNIMFLGYRKDVIELIRCMDFIVLSSRWEGLPLTPIEAFSQYKTVIASDIAGNNEIVQNKKNGLLFEKDNVEDLADKMFYFIKNKEEKAKMEKTSFSCYKEKYSYENFIKNYMNLYEKIYRE